MRILIAGPLEEVQEIADQLLIEKIQVKEGTVVEHTFNTKYFSAHCTLWFDIIKNTQEWCAEFSSSEAEEVRNALTAFVYCGFENEIEKFADLLDVPCLAVNLESEKFVLIEKDELLNEIHTLIFDAQQDEEEEEIDLEEIARQLKNARESDMTDDEKKELVDRIVGML